MIVMKEHSYLKLTAEMYADMFSVARQWFHRANKEDKRARFASIAWDLLIHAGASQVYRRRQIRM